MKNLLLVGIAGFLLLFGYTPLLAQDTVAVYRRPTLLKTNLLGPLSLFVEQAIAPRQSLQFSLQRIDFGLFGSTTKFFSFTPEMKFYLAKRPATEWRPRPAGWYVSPYLKYRNVREESESGFLGGGPVHSRITYQMLGGGAVAGGQVIFRRGFTIDAFLGGGYFPVMGYRTAYVGQNAAADASPEDFRWDIRFGFCFGYAFK